MPNTHTTLTSLFSDIADAIRGKTGGSEELKADDFPTEIGNIPIGSVLEPLENPAAADKILQGYEAYDEDGEVIEGTYEPSGTPPLAYATSRYRIASTYAPSPTAIFAAEQDDL